MPSTVTDYPSQSAARRSRRWLDLIALSPSEPATAPSRVLGILPGEGVGPEVIAAAMDVLDATATVLPIGLTRRTGGMIGHGCGNHDGALTDDVAEFCGEIFEAGGAVLCGPGGGRFVYDMRRRFDLFCKVAPLRSIAALHHLVPLRRNGTSSDVDILVVRDNAGGVYQGSWGQHIDPVHGCVAEHHFSYSESQVRQIVTVGARIAKARRGRIDVVVKDGGVPTISDLWRRTAEPIAREIGVACGFCNADFAAYDLIRRPQNFDVIVTPTLIGDILADLGAVFLGSRGLSYSANFSAQGHAVYQTGHGAAHDLARTDRCNPVGQILSMAMMLRESYGLDEAADLVERAIERVYLSGYRTDDLLEPQCRPVGTREMGELIAKAVVSPVNTTVTA